MGVPTSLPRAGGALDELGQRAAAQVYLIKGRVNASRVIESSKAKHDQAVRQVCHRGGGVWAGWLAWLGWVRLG